MRDNLGMLSSNVQLLRTRASRHAYAGVLIAGVAVLIATLLASWYQTGSVTLEGMFTAQASNPGLWLLDAMPFVFALWGQYFSVVVAHEAGAMILDQTQNLRSDNRLLEAQARKRANFDNLTGLANRELFVDRVEQAIQQAYSGGHRLGVLVLNLIDFSEINQSLGTHNGDRVLQSVAKRLSKTFLEPCTVARLGADSFAALLPRIADESALEAAGQRVSRALEPPFLLESVTLSVQASVGAALYPEHAVDADALVNNADLAMHQARGGTAPFKVFRTKDRTAIDPRRLSMVAELRQALMRHQLELFVQPIVDFRHGTISAGEALLRWPHQVHGNIPPSEFIPRAERSGMINEVTQWVLERSLDVIRQVRDSGRPFHMAVNLSARTLMDLDFPDTLAGLLAAKDLPGSALTLEITEDTLMSEHESIQAIIERIAAMGVRFAIDDFGTGYSQLAYLKRLPVSELKIDRSFISDMIASPVDRSIVEATINLAHVLDLQVIAEGVETLEQAQQLAGLRCDRLQGHLFAEAMPATSFVEWLAQAARNPGLYRQPDHP